MTLDLITNELIYIGQMPDNVPILATTATANDRVVNDIKSQIGEGLLIQEVHSKKIYPASKYNTSNASRATSVVT